MITEDEYLKCLKVVRDYKKQVVNQVEEIEPSQRFLKDIILDTFNINENFNRTNLAKELKVSRGYICKVLRDNKNKK